MTKATQDPEDASVDLALDLDEEQLAQLDALIEEHATPSRRLTREEMLHLLVERGSDLVAQGESLLPYLDSPPAGDDTTKP